VQQPGAGDVRRRRLKGTLHSARIAHRVGRRLVSRGERYGKGVAMYEPDEDDVVEQGGSPLRLPGWARRPRWLPSLGRGPSRWAAVLGIAGHRRAGGRVRARRPAAAADRPAVADGTVAGCGRGRRALDRGWLRRAGVPAPGARGAGLLLQPRHHGIVRAGPDGRGGRTDTAQLAGLPDLGQVADTGCKGSS
jgi:hypothetical protein